MKTFLLSLLLALAGCATKKPPTPVETAEIKPLSQEEVQDIIKEITDNAKNSVAWDGLYQGVLPCNLPKCDGVAMSLLLSSDQSYVIRSRNVGVSKEDHYIEGFFDWKDRNTIELKNKSESLLFRVSVLSLEMLSPKGETLSNQYRLEKIFDAPPST